jgi:hypothetical protein
MTIPTIEYRGHELRAYSNQVFPLHGDPYAKGPRRFASVVRIDAGPSSNAGTRRYAVQFAGSDPALSVDALNLALQYGKDIIDGKIQPAQL